MGLSLRCWLPAFLNQRMRDIVASFHEERSTVSSGTCGSTGARQLVRSTSSTEASTEASEARHQFGMHLDRTPCSWAVLAAESTSDSKSPKPIRVDTDLMSAPNLAVGNLRPYSVLTCCSAEQLANCETATVTARLRRACVN